MAWGQALLASAALRDSQCWEAQQGVWTSALIILVNHLVFPSGGADPAWAHGWFCWLTDPSAFPGEARQGQADRGLCCCLLLTLVVKFVNFLTISTCGKTSWGWFFWEGRKAAFMYTLEPPQKRKQVERGVKCFIATFCNFSIQSELNKILPKKKILNFSAFCAGGGRERALGARPRRCERGQVRTPEHGRGDTPREQPPCIYRGATRCPLHASTALCAFCNGYRSASECT